MEATSAPRPHAFRIPKPRKVLAALSDDKLVSYVRRGDPVAFEVLYDRHSAGVLGFCRHMLRSAHDAEDAVQHTFIAAHADLQRSAARELHFKAWLYTIARNRCLSVLRARHDQPVEDMEIVSDRLNDDVEQRADLRALVGDIHKLPVDQREALVLSEVGALSHGEVAEVVGCEVSKVKSLVFQARTALIDRRLARETPCEEIREQIATLRGGALRRSHLRHHLEACPGCSEYREQVRRQRAMLGLALPVIPSAALRGDVLAAVGLAGGTVAAAGSAGVGGGLAIAAKSGLAKVGIAALIAGGAAGSAAVVTGTGLPGLTGSSAENGQSGDNGSGAGTGRAGTTSGTAAIANDDKNGSAPPDHSKAGSRSTSGSEHGFTPVQGGSNGAAAREFAATRGNGRHTGIGKTKHTPTRTRARRHAAKRTHVRKTPTTAPRANTTPTTPRTQATPKTESAPKTKTAPEQQAPATEPAPTTTSTEPAPAPTTDPSTTLGGAGGKSGTKRASG